MGTSLAVNNIFFAYPTGFLLLCALLGAAYAALLYWRDSRFVDVPALRISLAVLRFTAVSVIAVLLLEPFLRYFDREVEPPIVVIAADNSQSIILGNDSLEARVALPQMLQALQNELGQEYKVTTLTFGQDVKEGLQMGYDEPLTDLSAVFREVNNRYTNRNLGALILATDGLYNRGANPRYQLGNEPWMVLPIALGDTTIQRDALIAEVAVNRIAYLGNKFPIELVVEAQKFEGDDLNFSLSHDGAVIHSERIAIKGPSFRHTLRLLPEATKPGTQRYTLRIAPLQGEATLVNNVRDVYVDVIDGRQQVLIIAAAPHPDLGALRAAISSNENYQAELIFLNDELPELSAYDLVVLHQIPTNHPRGESLRLKLLASDRPIFSIIGTQTVPSMIPRFGLGVDMGNWRGSYHDVGAHVAEGFSTFRLDEGLASFLRDAPPLKAPFGEWRRANSADVLLFQRVGSIRTDAPLLLVNQTQERKVAVLLGEGIWRWRLYDYATAQSHARFDGLISSLVQYLALKADKRFFRISHEASFMENERVVLNAELYNDAYEPVNEPEVTIVFSHEEGREYPFSFSRTSTGYRLDAGSLPVGNYTYVASARRSGEKLEERGRISIKPYALEGASLTANHALLEALAEGTGGKVFYPLNAGEIKDYLAQTQRLKPVSYTTEVFNNALNLKWIFFLILALLSMEWFLRKRAGEY